MRRAGVRRRAHAPGVGPARGGPSFPHGSQAARTPAAASTARWRRRPRPRPGSWSGSPRRARARRSPPGRRRLRSRRVTGSRSRRSCGCSTWSGTSPPGFRRPSNPRTWCTSRPAAATARRISPRPPRHCPRRGDGVRGGATSSATGGRSRWTRRARCWSLPAPPGSGCACTPTSSNGPAPRSSPPRSAARAPIISTGSTRPGQPPSPRPAPSPCCCRPRRCAPAPAGGVAPGCCAPPASRSRSAPTATREPRGASRCRTSCSSPASPWGCRWGRRLRRRPGGRPRALRLDDAGHLAAGARGDLVALATEHEADLVAHLGAGAVRRVVVAGRVQR